MERIPLPSLAWVVTLISIAYIAYVLLPYATKTYGEGHCPSSGIRPKASENSRFQRMRGPVFLFRQDDLSIIVEIRLDGSLSFRYLLNYEKV
jgi:hypothetical protein